MRNLPIPVGFTPELTRMIAAMMADRRINTGPAQPLTVALKAVTIPANYSFFSIDGTAASNDLNKINGGLEGDLIFLQLVSNSRAVVLKHGAANILCNGAGDLNIADVKDLVMLHFDGTNWKAIIWLTG